jgi:hypothetical protein
VFVIKMSVPGGTKENFTELLMSEPGTSWLRHLIWKYYISQISKSKKN